MNAYYKKKQIIAKCDKKGNILGPIEKWEAHRKAILHRAFTVALIFDGKLVTQHRKHPAFDGVFDITSSSHQLFESEKIQDTVEAIYECVEREWELSRSDLSKPQNNGQVYYKARDSKSEFTEHEVCDIYTFEVSKFPMPKLDVAYGVSFIDPKELKKKKSRLYENLAPWVIAAIEENKL
jgi:isopentenyldiphosphate isomerase